MIDTHIYNATKSIDVIIPNYAFQCTATSRCILYRDCISVKVVKCAKPIVVALKVIDDPIGDIICIGHCTTMILKGMV
jgi:hypothetical protein